MNTYPIQFLLNLLIAFVALSIPKLSAHRFADIDLEFASIATDSWDLTDSDVVYQEKNIDHNYVSKPYLSSWTKDGYSKSLKFQASPMTPDASVKQRSEYYVYRDEPLPFYEAIYIGFSFAVIANPSDIQDWTLIMQCQQLGEFVSPFLSFALENNNGQMELVVAIRNSTYYGVGGVNGPGGNALKVYRHPIDSGVWNDVLLGVSPDPFGAGELVLKIDDVEVLNWTGSLGLPADFLGYPFVESFHNTFGIYRQSQNGGLIVYFDNYRLADVSFSAVP